MHLTRTRTSKRYPIPRKGTKYVARARDNSLKGIPVVVAVRDMLKLARSAKEVKFMISKKLLEVNGLKVKDLRDSLNLFSIFGIGKKKYILSLLPTGRFTLEETKKEHRICKVVNKTALKDGKIQLNLHDGGNLISKEKVSVGDSIELDFKGKIGRVLHLDKGKKVFIDSGRNIGKEGKIESIDGKKIKIKLEDRVVELNQVQVIVI